MTWSHLDRGWNVKYWFCFQWGGLFALQAWWRDKSLNWYPLQGWRGQPASFHAWFFDGRNCFNWDYDNNYSSKLPNHDLNDNCCDKKLLYKAVIWNCSNAQYCYICSPRSISDRGKEAAKGLSFIWERVIDNIWYSIDFWFLCHIWKGLLLLTSWLYRG